MKIWSDNSLYINDLKGFASIFKGLKYLVTGKTSFLNRVLRNVIVAWKLIIKKKKIINNGLLKNAFIGF